jgi:TRAP transporter TAXI family solute receptor
MNTRVALIVAASLAWIVPVADLAAQSPAQRRTAVNENVVGIISSNITSSMTRLSQDLAYALNEPGKLRILPILGRGSIGNIEDLIYLRGVDLALLQGDVLEFYQRFEAEPGIFDKIRCVAELAREEVHLMARSEFSTIDQLQGARVNFGESQGGSFLTASIVFDEAGVQISPTNMSHADAILALKRGEIDAMLYATNAPIPLFEGVSRADGVHLIDIPPERIKAAVYEPGEITSEHYPALIDPGRPVRTIKLGTMLVGYNWPHDHPRYTNVRKFIDTFRTKFDALQHSESYHPAWQHMNPKWEVPGWRCFE